MYRRRKWDSVLISFDDLIDLMPVTEVDVSNELNPNRPIEWGRSVQRFVTETRWTPLI